jgi:high-affinity Fe2+/Pb2+ permease
MFPLSDSGYAGAFQDIMHTYVVTVAVVLLSIVSLILIIIGGFRKKTFPSLAIWAAISLAAMCAGAIGVGVAPAAYFGVFERFSVFAATAFNAVLGIYLFNGKLERDYKR